jgi:hypothetical protein
VPIFIFIFKFKTCTFERTKWSQAINLILCRVKETTYVAAIGDIEAKDIYAAPLTLY